MKKTLFILFLFIAGHIYAQQYAPGKHIITVPPGAAYILYESPVGIDSTCCEFTIGKHKRVGQSIRVSVSPYHPWYIQPYLVRFLRWSDGNTDTVRYFTLSNVCDTIKAIFELVGPTKTLSLTTQMGGISGTVTGGGNYLKGSFVIITATPDDVQHYRFQRWSDGNTDNPRSMYLDEDMALTAYFTPRTENGYVVSVKTSNSDLGSVYGARNGTYVDGSTINIGATARNGSYFWYWSDGSRENPRTITVNQDILLTANFGAYPLIAVTNVSPFGAGSTIISGSFNTQCNNSNLYYHLYAKPNTGYRFSHWSDGNRENPRKVATTSPLFNNTLTAYFENVSYTISLSANSSNMGTVSGGGTYNVGSSATITATPYGGYRFVQWSDGNTDNPRTITVNSNLSLTAYFEQISTTNYTVMLSAIPSNMGIVLGGGTYTAGSSATITATPYSGYRFLCWSDGNTENPRTITVNNNLSLTAYFEQISTTNYTVTLSANPSNMGVVSGGGTYTAGSSATILASPYSGYRFVRWSDGSTDNPRTITVNNNLSLTAYFEQISTTNYTVSLSASPSFFGTVSGSGTYRAYDNVEISATSYDTQFPFIGWYDRNGEFIDDCNPCEFLATDNLSIVAYFGQIERTFYTLTLLASPSTTGSVIGGGTYVSYEDAIITAIPNNGYRFVRWHDGNTENPRTITVDENRSLIACFEQISTTNYTVTLSANPSNMGVVSGGGTYTAGSYATITASPYSGYRFIRWSDGSTDNPRTITVNNDISLVAYFEQIGTSTDVYYTVTLTASPSYMGSVLGGGTYRAGEDVTISATPASQEYYFSRWSDGNTSNPRTIYNLSSDLSLTAYFNSPSGIENISDSHVTAFAQGRHIIVMGAKNMSVAFYDMQGRQLETKQSRNDQPLRFDAPATGIYMVRVGNLPAQRVAILR